MERYSLLCSSVLMWFLEIGMNVQFVHLIPLSSMKKQFPWKLEFFAQHCHHDVL